MPSDDIARLYDFTANTTIQSGQVDGEFDQIISTINNKFGRSVANTLTGNNTFSGTNTFSGVTTFSSGTTPVRTDKVDEYTPAAGVTVDNVLLKDGMVTVSGTPASAGQIGYASNVLTFYNGSAVKTLATTDNLYPKGFMNGVAPLWVSASTVRIPAGFSCKDSSNAVNIDVTVDLDAVLSSSGAGGLDTGAEASNTTYYLWLIAKADGTKAAMFSTSVSSPTMPTDYIYKRRMKGAWRNNASSNLLEMQYGHGYPYRPLCLYDVPMTVGASAGATNIGNTSSTSYAAYDCTAFAPEAITKLVLLHVAANTGNSAVVVRPGDETGDHQTVGMATSSGGGQRGFSDLIRLDSADGTIDAKLETASGTHYIDVKGFVDTLGD